MKMFMEKFAEEYLKKMSFYALLSHNY